jgi:PTH1 family peptidyl-tRNA hydrolase
MENLYLIVGLGNPGRDYARTRHNAGFQVVERLAQRWQAAWASERKFHARLARAEPEGRRALLAKPQTYMNASGEAVGALVAFYRVAPAQLLVVADDADLPLGRLRLKPGGGTAGHHGLESIQQHVGTRDYARLRVGIGRREGAREITGHVLGRFDSTEVALVDKVMVVACDAVECWLRAGAQTAMNQFNGVNLNVDPGSERTDQ